MSSYSVSEIVTISLGDTEIEVEREVDSAGIEHIRLGVRDEDGDYATVILDSEAACEIANTLKRFAQPGLF